MDFKIEDNVPLPTSLGVGGNNKKYPFGELQVGQSFAIPKNLFKKAQTAGWQYANRKGLKFVFRMNGKEGRCFRIA